MKRRVLALLTALWLLLSASGCSMLLEGTLDYILEEGSYEGYEGYGDYEYYGDDGAGSLLDDLLGSPDSYSSGASGSSPGSAYGTGYPEAEYDPADPTWSVFIYMCGTDLESKAGMATSNLAELTKLTTTDSASIIVQTGGTNTWRNNIIDSGRMQRYLIDNGSLKLVDEGSLRSMGDADTLGDFLSWGVESYPADNYMVIFWDHGGGSIGGLIYDEVFSFDCLTLDEMAEGIKAAGVTFEVIGFDTCLMATLETAAAIAPYGRYMVASEEYEPGGGWDYRGWGSFLYSDPSCTGEELGRAICDTYYEKCRYSGDSAMATLSVIDLARIPALVAAFDAMAQEMTGVSEDISALRAFAQGAMRAENYGGNTSSEGYSNMVDLGDLAINTESVLVNTADSLLDALFDAVKYQVKGSNRSSANGLSVFFPLGVTAKDCEAFVDVATSPSYVRFVDMLVPGWDGSGAYENVELPEWYSAEQQQQAAELPDYDSVQSDDVEIDAESYIDQDGYYTVEILSGLDAVESVMFNLYYMDYDYGEYMLLGTDNDIDGDWDEGIFTDNFRGVWFTLNGEYCAPVLIAEEEDYNLYSIPILLNGEETNLRAAFIWESDDSGHFEIYGAWKGLDTDTGMSARDIVKLKDGDEVVLLFDAQNWDTGEATTYAMGSFTVNGEVVLEESPLFDGEYLYEFVIRDLFGREYYSAPVILEVDGEDISIYETE